MLDLDRESIYRLAAGAEAECMGNVVPKGKGLQYSCGSPEARERHVDHYSQQPAFRAIVDAVIDAVLEAVNPKTS